MRTSHERGVADENNPARAHARHLDIVDRLQKRPLRKRHDVPKLRGQQRVGRCVEFRDHRTSNQRRWDRNLVMLSGNVRQKARERGLVSRPVPDDVVAPVAGPQVIAWTSDRIAQHLFAWRQAESQGVEQIAVQRWRKRMFRSERTPCHVSGIA
jgi:hypothetical protein